MVMLTVHDIMEKHPKSIESDDFITHARQIMRDYHHRILPVVDNNEKVLGIITEQDILNITSTKSNITVKGFVTETPVITEDMSQNQAARIMLKAGITRSAVTVSEQDSTLCGIISIVDIFKNLDPSTIIDKNVSDYMSTNINTCTPDDSLAKVWINMVTQGYSGYPVVDKHKRPIGMVTRRDIIKSGGVRIEREDEHGTRIGTSSKVERVMSTPPFTIAPDAPLKDAVEMLVRLDVGRLCVVNLDKLVGIIDRYDIVKAYYDEQT
jgi:CBS domain-containing protein